ncbi:MAG: hypothetical protein LBU60_04935 [Clostridiales bacterium]|jgi:hypothetical protein|nr:hypothetical protein [Clostridiales bacterium]
MKKNLSSCNSKFPNKKSNKPFTEHSLKDSAGVTDNIKHKSIAFNNTNDTGMQHQ